MVRSNNMTLPGFTAGCAIETEMHFPWRNERSATSPDAADSVTPSESRREFCGRLLTECISGPNPRSISCDSWLFLC
jgi:hypothetical protein